MSERVERIEHPVGADGSVTIRGVEGEINVTGIDGETATVIAQLSDVAQLNIEKTDGGLLVEQRNNDRLWFGGLIRRDHSVSFEVALPRGARLEVRSVSGDVTVRDFCGVQTLRTVSGDIRLISCSGRVSSTTVSGDVKLTDGGRLEVGTTTTSGDVELQAQSLVKLTARSVSGDVKIVGGLETGPRNSVETVSGDLRLEATTGVTVELARAVDMGSRGKAPLVVGDGAARLMYRTLSGSAKVVGGQRASSVEAADDRMAVLKALERGEISVEDAAERLAVTRG